jgi:hypothetical protein
MKDGAAQLPASVVPPVAGWTAACLRAAAEIVA